VRSSSARGELCSASSVIPRRNRWWSVAVALSHELSQITACVSFNKTYATAFVGLEWSDGRSTIEGMDDQFWDDCPLVSRDPEMVHGTPVLKGTRLPADTLVGSVESYEELSGMTEDQAIDATLEDFPSTPGGKDALRALLAYQESRLHQPQP
jgi:uncharacterized protein (DUF433 family)